MASKSEVVFLAVAVKRGLVTAADAQAAMDEQKRLAPTTPIRLSDLLIANGKLQPKDVAEIITGVTGNSPKPTSITLDEARRIPIYDVQEKIGEGAMASVFRAIHRETGQPRAVKILMKDHLANRQFVERFVREGKLLKQFDCPNIVKGFEYGRAGKELYFMGMELVDGWTLQESLDREGPFPEQKAVYCVTEAARALAYMQSQGIVHRDIKPDNIMWHVDGRVLLVDLGFAKAIDGSTGGFEDETCGTVQYISPEQAKGLSDLDIRADIYSLGATLYHLVVGQTPFGGRDSMEVMAKQVMENLDAHKLKGGKVSMHMHYFIEKMMAKDRAIRYQSAQDIVDDIEDVLAGAADLQYNPDNDETVVDPFSTMSRRMPGVGQAPQRSVRAPALGSSTRMQPVAAPNVSVRMPAAAPVGGGTGANGKSVRMPAPRQSTRLRATDTAKRFPRDGG